MFELKIDTDTFLATSKTILPKIQRQRLGFGSLPSKEADSGPIRLELSNDASP